MATVVVPALLREYTAGAPEVQIAVPAGEQRTVRQLLEQVDAQYPGILDALLYEGDLMPGIAVFIDNDHALMGLAAKARADSEVRFLPPVVGG